MSPLFTQVLLRAQGWRTQCEMEHESAGDAPVKVICGWEVEATFSSCFSCLSLFFRCSCWTPDFWPPPPPPTKSHDARPGVPSFPLAGPSSCQGDHHCTAASCFLPHPPGERSITEPLSADPSAAGAGTCFIYPCSCVHYLWLLPLQRHTHTPLRRMSCDHGEEASLLFLMSPLIPLITATRQSEADLHLRLIRTGKKGRGGGGGGN